jgi:hypothetical protein
MSTASRQPYSDAMADIIVDAFAGPEDPEAWRNQTYREWARPVAEDAVARMHDRSVLGLDASARIGDVLEEIVTLLRTVDVYGDVGHIDVARSLSWREAFDRAATYLLRNFEADDEFEAAQDRKAWDAGRWDS